MAKSLSRRAKLPMINTVKLTNELRVRVARVMEVGGFGRWSEFCRIALTEKCRSIERDARTRDCDKFEKVLGAEHKAGVDAKFRNSDVGPSENKIARA